MGSLNVSLYVFEHSGELILVFLSWFFYWVDSFIESWCWCANFVFPWSWGSWIDHGFCSQFEATFDNFPCIVARNAAHSKMSFHGDQSSVFLTCTILVLPYTNNYVTFSVAFLLKRFLNKIYFHYLYVGVTHSPPWFILMIQKSKSHDIIMSQDCIWCMVLFTRLVVKSASHPLYIYNK